MLLMGKLTISMAIFNSYVKLPEGTLHAFKKNEFWIYHDLCNYVTANYL